MIKFVNNITCFWVEYANWIQEFIQTKHSKRSNTITHINAQIKSLKDKLKCWNYCDLSHILTKLKSKLTTKC